MAVKRKTISLLPSIFRTDTNKKFLGSTLDQLISEPELKKVNGFIGRKFAPAIRKKDNFIIENSSSNQNYQLEPSLVVKNDLEQIVTYGNYNDFINKIAYYGGITQDHDRLFESEYYTFNPQIDLDKFVNYSQYHWLPNGPSTVLVSARSSTNTTAYTFSYSSGAVTTNATGAITNPTLVLKRGTSYTLSANPGAGNVWIQTEPGISGSERYNPGQSTRQVFGVTNNGTNSVTFQVPAATAQNSDITAPVIQYVDYAISETFTALDNSVWLNGSNPWATISGEQFYANDQYVIFTTSSDTNADWTDYTGSVVPNNKRRGIWKLQFYRTPVDPAVTRIRLQYVRDVANGARISINTSKINLGREYIKTSGLFVGATKITAPLTRLYYQFDQVDISGEIEIVEQSLLPINVNNIINSKNYTTNDGVVFTNGLKIYFDNTVTPSSYHNKTYIVEGVGTSIRLVDYDVLQSPESVLDNNTLSPEYFTINRSSLDGNAWSRVNRWFHIDTIRTALRATGSTETFDESNRAQRPIIEFNADLQLFNHGRIFGSRVDYLFDSGFQLDYQGTKFPIIALNQVSNQTSRSLKQAGLELSSGDRIILAQAQAQAERRAVYTVSYADQSGASVFDGTATGTFSGLIGQTQISGIGTAFISELVVGDQLFTSANVYIGRVARIISVTEFYLDAGSTVNLIAATGIKIKHAVINLTQYLILSPWHSVFVTKGTHAKQSFYLNNILFWNKAQTKSRNNQEPLFDVIEVVGGQEYSFGSNTRFNSTSFTGTKLFSYARGSTTVDSVLGFSLGYSGIGSIISDINFYNHYENDSFTYKSTASSNVLINKKINTGFLRKITNFLTYEPVNLWSTVKKPDPANPVDSVVNKTKQYQLISNEYDGLSSYFEIGVYPETTTGTVTDQPNIKVYVNNKIIVGSAYTVETVGTRIAIRVIPELLTAGDQVDILIYSKNTSEFGFYQIPQNLEYNAENQVFQTISLGQIRNHLIRVGENLTGLTGSILGTNNLRDINYSNTPGTLLQHSAGLLPAMSFLLDDQVNFFAALDYARREYTRFKNRFLETAVTLPQINQNDIGGSVDRILAKLSEVKTKDFAWYYSDMLPHGNEYTESKIKVTNVNQINYAVSLSVYDNQIRASNQAVLVYKNGVLLTKGIDYDFVSGFCRLLSNPTVGDEITVREYQDTTGSFVPETPTKLALYPKFRPVKYLDNTYRQPINVVQGHDGSIMPAFDDFRDDLILELERRIYNNIKVDYSTVLFDISDVIPGHFRTTDYNLEEFNNILNSEFLKWVGTNQVDYSTNSSFANSDPFTYNYNRTLNQQMQTLPGYWRGIYKHYFDTDRPHSHPWEILGFSIRPPWWDTYYSWTNSIKRSALILAIETGLVSEPGQTNVYNLRYRKSGFGQQCPVDSSGNLISPLTLLVADYNSSRFSGSFVVGDHGPVETAWRRSSEYAFALQKVMALMKPARYFGLLFNVGQYNKNTQTLNQYASVQTGNRISFRDIDINGEAVNDSISRAVGYVNWITSYLAGQGLDSFAQLRNLINYTNINLSYKLNGFTDKQYITVLSEQFSPGSTNQSVIIPDENYQVYLDRSVPVDRIVYSAVIIEKTNAGWSVTGYDIKNPFFNIIPSDPAGGSYSITALNLSAVIFKDYKKERIIIPYGYQLTSTQQVVDFLVSYQRYLQAQGFTFDIYDTTLQQRRDWILSAKEFLTWSQQGWPEGKILVLSPVLDQLTIGNTEAVVDDITNKNYNSSLVGVNYNPIRKSEFIMLRDNGLTTISTLSGQTIALADLNLVQYQHVLIFDNRTVFDDILYSPELGNRQYRLKLVGSKTDNWDGELTPPGFIYNSGIVDSWKSGVDYHKGDIVTYKNKNYTAIQNIDAADSFNFNYWSLLDNDFTQGLVPNFAQNAARLVNIYDIDNQPLDETYAKFSNGLIGFRNRTFLADLGLDQTSQSKLYQGYIKEKGTLNSVSALSRGEFDGLSSSISVYEEWAARVGEYGAIDANPEITVQLTETIARKNPVGLVFLPDSTVNDNNLVDTVKSGQILSRTPDFKPEIFLNRNLCDQSLWKIELFGDGLLCGRVPAEQFSYSITVNDADNIVDVGQLINITVTSPDIIEVMFYSIEPVGLYETPGSITTVPVILNSCLNDRVSGRVAEPPDYLLYQRLDSEFRVAITTRSVENSTSSQLLAGTDGVNDVWPDDIEADIVIINHALNDARQNVPISVYRNNLLELRKRLDYSKHIIWLPPTPVLPSIATWTTQIQYPFSAYVDVMREIARQFGDYFADTSVIPNWSSYITVDGVYPSQQGYQALVDQVLYPMVRQALYDKTRAKKKYYEDDLRTGGYPLVTDVDYQFFDLRNYRNISSTVLKSLYTGFRLWVAKDFNKDWQVYRAFVQGNIITTISHDANNKFVITCSELHELSIGDLIAINNINTTFDGFYVITAVTDYTITVTGTVDTDSILLEADLENLEGELVDFQKLRFSNVLEFQNTRPKHEWFTDYHYSVVGTIEATGTVVQNAVIVGDTLRFNLTSVALTENLYFSIEDLANTEMPNSVTVAANTNTTYKDVCYIDQAPGACENWMVVEPTVLGYQFRLRNQQTVTYTDSYSINIEDCLATDCFDIDDFVAKYARIYSRSNAEFKQAALDLLPLFNTNNAYTVTSGADTVIRYALNRTVDTVMLGYWTNQQIVTGTGITDINFRTSFFNSLLGADYQRSRTAVKDFDTVTADFPGCALFRDRGLSQQNPSDVLFVSIYSLDFTETLQWSIEAPVAADYTANIPVCGVQTTVINNPKIDYLGQYGYRVLRTQEPVVDIDSVNNLYLYSNRTRDILTRLDFIDPAKGRILGTAQQDIDFTTSIDPAKYRFENVSTGLPINVDYYWGQSQLGTYWWNMDACRYIHYEQSSLDYRISHWGELFPGSSIEIYEWIESDYLPSQYQLQGGLGVPLYVDDSAYNYSVYVDPATNGFVTKYYYWVRSRETKPNAAKRHSTASLENIILNPTSQNIPYMAMLKNNSVALYNIAPYLTGSDTLLHVSSKRKISNNIIHSDFQLIQEGNPDARIPARVENKIIDSLIGKDILNKPVPDIALSQLARYGLSNHPNQTVIKQTLIARENVIKFVNSMFEQYAVSNRIYDRIDDNFFAKQDFPAANTYTISVNTFADIDSVVVLDYLPKLVLVKSDENHNNYWTVYSRNRKFGTTEYINTLVRRQSYDVSKLWRYRDWYAEGYSNLSTFTYTVNTARESLTLPIRDGDTVKILNVATVINNQQQSQTLGQFEIYKYSQVGQQLTKTLIGLEKGTIEILGDFYTSAGFDSVPFDTVPYDYDCATELRFILKGLKETIFAEDLENQYNRMLYFVIDYILSEQQYIDWFMKTSFVTIKNNIQDLTEQIGYYRDKQQYYEQYINEVKPYRTKIRQFLAGHSGIDHANFALTDFDLPAYFDSSLNVFRSPNFEYPNIDSAKLQEPAYKAWTDNYKYNIESYSIAAAGYGYFSTNTANIDAPDLSIIRSDSEIGQSAQALIQVDPTVGFIANVTAVNFGSNYTQTPTVTVQGNGGTWVNNFEIQRFRVTARGFSDTAAPVAWGLHDMTSNTAVYSSAARSYTMHRVRRSDGRLMFTRSYDVYGDAAAAKSLAQDLNDTSSDFVVVVYSYDEPSNNRLTNNLPTAMYRCGASAAVFGSANFQSRSAYILIGIPGCGAGKGIEHYSGTVSNDTNAWCSVEFNLQQGQLAPIALNPRVMRLSTAFARPLTAANGSTYTYGNRSWTYTLSTNTWTQITGVTSLLPGDSLPRNAVIVPNMTNNKVRRIRTVIKFDRLQYFTSVAEWNTANTYSQGSFVSYQGRAYQVQTTMTPAEVFDFTKVDPIGAAEPVTSRTYLNGYFTNANDRIMAFYQPSVHNGMVPKSIDRLVTGVQDAWATYNSTTLAIPLDTNLVGDTFGSNAGISAGNISVIGGQFIDVLASHAPEELVPGIVFESISIRTITTTASTTGFRLFIDMNNTRYCTDFSPSSITTLTQDLLPTDTEIIVADGSRLSAPNTGTLTPGIIHVNGERIIYYSKVGNVLGQLRRAVGGTGIAERHLSGSEVEDASVPARSGSNCSSYAGPHNQ